METAFVSSKSNFQFSGSELPSSNSAKSTNLLNCAQQLDEWRAAWALEYQPWIDSETDRAFKENYSTLFPAGLSPLNLPTLIPLCGDSRMVRYLTELGHPVTGVDFVKEALAKMRRRDFSSIQFNESKHGTGRVYTHGTLRLIEDNFLSFKSTNEFSLVYDRAALITISPSLRERYCNIISKAMRVGGVLFVESFDIGVQSVDEPPFPLSLGEIADLFADFNIERSWIWPRISISPRLSAKGVSHFLTLSIIARKLR